MNKKKKAILGTLLFATILTGAYVHNQAFVGVEKRLTIKNPKVKDDLRITHISDFHSNVISNLDDVLKNIRAFNPDLIFLTGDMIDYPTDKKIERTMFFLENLSKIGIKTYYVSGNHEEVSNASGVFYEKIKNLGIKKLDNEGENLIIRDNEVYIYGVPYWGMNLDEYMPGAGLNLILAHFSKNIRENYDPSMDIIFSGHTHGGQVRAPFIGALIAPGEGLLPDYDSGLYSYKESEIYVSSGLGNTFLPLRFLDPISYTNITIKRP